MQAGREGGESDPARAHSNLPGRSVDESSLPCSQPRDNGAALRGGFEWRLEPTICNLRATTVSS